MLSLVSASSSAFAAPTLAARAPAVNVRMQGSGSLESPIPGMPRPAYLDGTLAGDVGLDPLGLVEKLSRYTIKVPAATVEESDVSADYKNLKKVEDRKLYLMDITLGANSDRPERQLMWMREAEVKHARLAMLAAAGWPLAELWHGPLCNIFRAEYALDVTQGRSLSVLNGGLGEVVPFLFFAFLAASAVECKTLDQVYGLTATGLTKSDNGGLVMKSYVPGDCGFDPLGLYGWFGDNVSALDKMEAKESPRVAFELVEKGRREMETAEIKNGRLAMLAITGYAIQECVYGTPVVDQTPLFFTFFGDLLAPGALSSLGLF